MIHKNNLPDHVLQWVVDSVDEQGSVESVYRLHGGTSSSVHHISIRTSKDIKKVVLRQIDNKEWLREEPDLVRHEAESLRCAHQVGLPTPQILAIDETGSQCGIPAVLMTKLEGSVILDPRHLDYWLDGLAETLVQIHAVKDDGFPWTYFTYNNITTLETPTWTKFPESWEVVIDIVKGPRPKVHQCFIHRDYHPSNVLWHDGSVSGVVDWVNACRGPTGIDVGHCRVNLAQLFDVQTADAFLTAYQRHAGAAFNYDPYWDLLSLIDILFGTPKVYEGWTALGVTGLTDKLMMERLDAYMLSLMERVTANK